MFFLELLNFSKLLNFVDFKIAEQIYNCDYKLGISWRRSLHYKHELNALILIQSYIALKLVISPIRFGLCISPLKESGFPLEEYVLYFNTIPWHKLYLPMQLVK